MLLSGQNGPCSLTLLQIDPVGQTKIHPCLHIVYLQRCVILGTNMLIMYVGSKPDTADLTLQKGPLTSPPPTHRYCKYSWEKNNQAVWAEPVKHTRPSMLITSQSTFLDLRYHDAMGCSGVVSRDGVLYYGARRGRSMSLKVEWSSETRACVLHITYHGVMPLNPHQDKLFQTANNVWKWLKGGGLHSAGRFAGSAKQNKLLQRFRNEMSNVDFSSLQRVKTQYVRGEMRSLLIPASYQHQWIRLIVYSYPHKWVEPFYADHVTPLTSAEPAWAALLQVCALMAPVWFGYNSDSRLLTRSFAHPLTHPLSKQPQPTISTRVRGHDSRWFQAKPKQRCGAPSTERRAQLCVC